jgi:hypothetical protein
MDESGAKGYAKNKETTLGELGLMAGYFLPEEHVDQVRFDLELIRSRFLIDGKLHITDLHPDKQKELRESIFSYFLSRKIFWTYEAVYVEGLHQYARAETERHENIRKKRRSSIRLSNHKKQILLHAELFQGVFGKGIAFCNDMVGESFNLSVITDRVDSSLLASFSEKAKELLNVGAKREVEVTGYDLEKKEKVKFSFVMEMTVDSGVLGDYSKVNFSIFCEDSALTLAADVLANSAHYHLKGKQKDTAGFSLNAVGAIAGHKLESILYGAWPDSETNYLPDALFMHPSNQF